MKRFMLLLFVSILIDFGFGFEKQLLTGKWNVKNENGSIDVYGNVPGGIYTDLMINGLLPDIYYRFNDVESRWVAKENWTYTKIFKANETHFTHKFINLIFEGLDTFATIILNDITIGRTNNMFVRYTFDIKQCLKLKNNLTLVFRSPITEADSRYQKQLREYEVPPNCVPKNYNGECHVNHIRKMQASFAWDWGPAFPSVGVWKPVYIISHNSAIIQDIIVKLIPKQDEWVIKLKIYLETNSPQPLLLKGVLITTLRTELNTVSIIKDVIGTTDGGGGFVQDTSLSIPKMHVNLWWPNGFGKQFLYFLKVTYSSYGTDEKVAKKIRIGFRTVELIQKPTNNGTTFYFQVNSIPIFAKGSNWIPANILPEHGMNGTIVKFLLKSAQKAHMNMLRVWGGGVYESEVFYQIADELGILIWQDFMFACSMYPTDSEFLTSVAIEVRQQVKRLQHHCSIAVWAGNNENEAALSGNWYNTTHNFTLYKRNYIKLYVDTIRNNCLSIDNTRPFVVSSPSNGHESEMEDYVSKNPYDLHYGDLHYYNYVANGWNENNYLNARFVSEYGFQSLPFYTTLKSSTNLTTTDLKIGSDFLFARQHLTGGYIFMTHLIEANLKLPNIERDHYLQTYIYYSQINQAMSVKMETEFYRQWRNREDSDGSGLTMGSLYWQLNDVWPAPSWSSIDFKGNWKMLHYFAQKFFAPILVTGNLSSANDVTIFVISDLTILIPDAKLTIYCYKWNSFDPINSLQFNLTIKPFSTNIVTTFWLGKYLERIGCGNLSNSLQQCFLYLTIENSNGKQLGPENFVFPLPLKSVIGLTTPNLTAIVKAQQSETIFSVLIKTDQITPFVWLSVNGIKGLFSENGFLQVTQYKTVSFESDEILTIPKLQSVLTVTSLLNKEHL